MPEKKFESLETHPLNDLGYHFSVAGINETKFANSDLPEQLLSLPGYDWICFVAPFRRRCWSMFNSDNEV